METQVDYRRTLQQEREAIKGSMRCLEIRYLNPMEHVDAVLGRPLLDFDCPSCIPEARCRIRIPLDKCGYDHHEELCYAGRISPAGAHCKFRGLLLKGLVLW